MFTSNLVRIMMFFLLTAQIGYVAAMDKKTECSQKAKILKLILEQVRWPSAEIPSNEIKVCLFGKFPNVSFFDALKNQSANSRKIVIKKISQYGQFNDCQLVYISESVGEDRKKFIKDYEKKPILLIADYDRFALEGGNMNFIILDQKTIGLSINVERMKESNLAFDLAQFGNITIFPEDLDINDKLK